MRSPGRPELTLHQAHAQLRGHGHLEQLCGCAALVREERLAVVSGPAVCHTHDEISDCDIMSLVDGARVSN